jgi:hypothetical protein
MARDADGFGAAGDAELLGGQRPQPSTTASAPVEETANMAVFMASDKASGMAGTTVTSTMGSLDE